MKKIILIFMMFFLMMSAGCKQTKETKDNELSMEVQSTSTEDNKKNSQQATEDLLDQLANRNFSIQGEKFSDADDETILEFGKTFVNLFNAGVAKQENVSFEKYISNKNLLKFTDEMLKLTQRQELQGDNAINYGLENEFGQAKLQHIGDNICYLELPFLFAGSGMTCRMLITSENKSLKLVDLYFGNKDGVDTFATGHSAVRKVDNPDLWNDEEWVRDVFDKLEYLGERLDLKAD